MLRAAESETLPVQTLKKIVERQKTILAEAAKEGDKFDSESLRVQVQQICDDYEVLLRGSPDFAAGFASYGYLLDKVGMRKEALAILLKAYKLDPEIPLVNNQIGNFLVEGGKPLEAVVYFRNAIRLDPTEPLYHYQLGTLLHVDRDEFLKSDSWTRESLSNAEHEAFKRAAELAPGRIEFTYRYAESFADLDKPDWDGALKAWTGLETAVHTPLELQVIQLQEANALIKLGRFDEARRRLDAVTEDRLLDQKQKLVAQLPAAPSR
jgi:tetratricopeptide (TPR) repeat protein